MKCLVKENLNVNGFSLKTDVPKPPLGFDEVRIRVLTTSVCGTDKNIYLSSTNEGIRKEMQRYAANKEDYNPIIVGHEFCGIVDEVGPGVTPDRWSSVPRQLLIEPGDYVTAEMHLSCGHCLQCHTGNAHICASVRVKGVHLDGCFAQWVCLPYKNVILLGKDGNTTEIPTRIGALLDAFGNAVHILQASDVRGKSVAILGAGPIGLMATCLAKAFGATRIYLTETTDVDRRCALGTTFGADECLNVSQGSHALYQSVHKHETRCNGVDVVLEVSGAASAYQDAFHVVRNGGIVILFGIPRGPLSHFDIAESVIWKGVTVQGIFGRRMFDTWETMLRLLRSDQFDIKSKLDKIVAQKHYRLDEHQEAFQDLAQSKEMKLIFTPNGPQD
ncbi:MAG: alcohol dehydrogenase catalytic domain-containing protein [Candidatus Melainabacteria bacterium]|nr:alcohol dehydrogenase catalytic domain-containing protein [Candidatus Melainabacteria bacterium]